MANAAKLPKRIIDAHNHVAHDDPGGSKLLEIMDSINAESALVMGTSGPSNQDALAAAREHPNRFIPGVYVDPREGPKAADELRHHRAEGVRVVKLFPNFGYWPDDDAFCPFFDVVAELGMAVLSHCGWLVPHMGVTAAYYSYPGRFEKPIRRHPETIFIMAHMGGIVGFLETVMLTTRTPNTYVDCSPGQGLWVLEHAPSMAAGVPADKLMWGADCYQGPQMLEQYCKALEGCGFGDDLDKIFYGNARGLLEKIGAIERSSGG